MVIPFIALLIVIVGLVLFFVLAGKKKREGANVELGDPRAGNPVHQPDTRAR